MGLFSSRPKVETRADTYTDTLVGLLVAQAGGSTVKATATAALEAAAGLVGRAFAAAEVEAPEPVRSALCPLTRSIIGRGLIRSGEAVFWADLRGSRLAFRAVSDWDITGSYDPDTWAYRLSLPGPSETDTKEVPGRRVIHARYQADPERPWRGVGPVESAALAGRLSAELANALADEASGTRGYLLPIPVGGEDPTVQKLKADLRTLRGQTALVESQSTGNFTADNRQVRAGGWEPHRLGANPPEPVVDLHTTATREIWAAVGFPAALFSAADGTASREAWRQVLHGVLSPLGTLVAEEVSNKTGVAVELTWSEIRASDITGRSRAFASLVEAGASFDSAAATAGLELHQESAPPPSILAGSDWERNDGRGCKPIRRSPVPRGRSEGVPHRSRRIRTCLRSARSL